MALGAWRKLFKGKNGMIYKANGDVYGSVGSITTKKMLSSMTFSLSMVSLSRSTVFEDMSRINDLRRSCGVEPYGGRTIIFRRYPGRKDDAR